MVGGMVLVPLFGAAEDSWLQWDREPLNPEICLEFLLIISRNFSAGLTELTVLENWGMSNRLLN